MNRSLTLEPASETYNTDALSDRKAFVRNLGVLLSQTRDDVVGADLGEDEVVTIRYRGGGVHRVNVNMDSYAAIVYDVAKHVQ